MGWLWRSVAILLACTATAAMAAAPPTDRERAVVDWLASRLRPHVDGPDRSRYTIGWADLNDDGRPEALAYVSGGDFCGTGGCNLYVVEVRGDRIRRLGNMILARPPIGVFSTRTHSYRDIGVLVCGGGILRCYRARVQFDGWKYMNNSTMAYAAKRGASERIIIKHDQVGRPLFEENSEGSP